MPTDRRGKRKPANIIDEGIPVFKTRPGSGDSTKVTQMRIPLYVKNSVELEAHKYPAKRKNPFNARFGSLLNIRSSHVFNQCI